MTMVNADTHAPLVTREALEAFTPEAGGAVRSGEDHPVRLPGPR